MITKFISTILILFLFTPGDEPWVERKNKDNIVVYTRKVVTSDYKEIKITTNVKTTLSSIVKALSDVDHFKDWIYNCTQATLVKKSSDADITTYQVFDVPWPSTDRDVVSRLQITQDKKTKVVTLASDIVNGLIPEFKELVRVADFHSRYILTPIADGSVDIDYELGTNPGGEVPAWLVNLVIVNAPYQTQEKLNELVLNPRYKSSKNYFIID